jgi:hypothetical protein
MELHMELHTVFDEQRPANTEACLVTPNAGDFKRLSLNSADDFMEVEPKDKLEKQVTLNSVCGQLGPVQSW